MLTLTATTNAASGDTELSDAEAWALAEFVKRVDWDTFRSHAVNDDEANDISVAVDKLRVALASAGIAPR